MDRDALRDAAGLSLVPGVRLPGGLRQGERSVGSDVEYREVD